MEIPRRESSTGVPRPSLRAGTSPPSSRSLLTRSSLAAGCLLALVTTWAGPALAFEEPGSDVGAKLVTAHMQAELRTAADHPGTSAVGDTTYVGFRPGKVTATNYWGIGKGNFKVYSTNPSDYGYWGWDDDGVNDNIAAVHGDSLFGWWPVRNLNNGTGGQTVSDDNRPWWALEIGNQVNYVINQGAAHKRTFGVVGVWHRDNGSASGGGVTWAPLSGSFSLWCGLRRDGDNAFSDPITGNPFNARTLAYTSSSLAGGTVGGGIGTNHKFPGYASQWDQMAYRDINMGASTSLSVRFKFRTNLSTGFGTTASTRTGWFDKDPLQVTPLGGAAGNFISSSAAGTNAPIDSFMVYVGTPVNDAATLYSDGVTRAVYDPQRRWFDEVIQANAPSKYRELFTTKGDNATQTVTLGPINTAPFGARVRLVFRNHTNRGFDDEGGSVAGAYSSNGAGAVVIDDVEVDTGSGFTNIGDFETPGQIDNSTGTDPLNAWKTTGKPPAIYHHVHNIASLIYEDLCGPVGGALRTCNLSGNVISMGNHDNSEASGGLVSGTADRDPFDGIISPTINLRSGGGTNEMDINAAIATVTEDYYIDYDIYPGIFDLTATSNEWRFGYSVYPARQSDGTLAWSDWRYPPFVLFDPDKQCFQDQQPGLKYGLLQWSAADAEGGAAYPDSIRFLLGKRQECYRFGIPECGGTDGAYWDNVSLAFVDGTSAPMTVNLWDWINDTFTVNGLNRNGVAPGSANFDTTSALVKTGFNTAQTTGTTLRYDVPGDTTLITAAGNTVRVDMVFRIDPGPGNYTTIGNRNSSLRRVPTSVTPVNIAAPTGHNFWEEYLLDNGAHGTPGGHPAGAVNGGKKWSNLVWNSARCDTAENSVYTLSARGLGVPTPGVFAAMYEETDPKFTKLGIEKNRCFLTTATAANNQANTVCDLSLTDGWPVAAGYVAENGLPLGHTFEFTKILPDGQFTPGTHVEYFFRREDTPIGYGPSMIPDTNLVSPQPAEGSTDGHRWQEFSVLPDAWKKGAYGGLGSACVLYVDLDDRHGDEMVWVSVEDSLGGTRATKYGAHNGWHAAGNQDPDDPASFVRNQNQEPGTAWDMFGVKASESPTARAASIGADLSNHASSFQIDDKWSFQGPSLGMLEAYYSMILILSGHLRTGLLGPSNDFGNDDVKMLEDFLRGGTSDAHRGLFVEGDGFVESASATPSNASLLNSYLYASLRDPSYLALSGNANGCVDLIAKTPISSIDVYGVRNGCVFTNDVLDAGTHATASSWYAPVGNATAPLIAGVFHDVDAASGEYWQSLVDGFDIRSVVGRLCGTSYGRLAYEYEVATDIFGKLCLIAGSPLITTDVPAAPSAQGFVDFLNVRNNPLQSGEATVEFGLAKPDRVEVKIYDVGGRLVRTLADRQFAAGRFTLTWDGVDSQGRALPHGVYFTQVRSVGRGFTESRKLTILK